MNVCDQCRTDGGVLVNVCDHCRTELKGDAPYLVQQQGFEAEFCCLSCLKEYVKAIPEK